MGGQPLKCRAQAWIADAVGRGLNRLAPCCTVGGCTLNWMRVKLANSSNAIN
jgi:hypothetical protein